MEENVQLFAVETVLAKYNRTHDMNFEESRIQSIFLNLYRCMAMDN